MSTRYEVLAPFFFFFFDLLLQATEDNEMALVEGEYIEQVEEVDDGWWTGVGPGGKTGLFPCTSCFPCRRDLPLTCMV